MTINDTDLKDLEHRVDELIRSMESLKRENSYLKESHASLLNERARLIEKNEHARSKVEAMINRLKTMEQDNP